MKKIVALSVSFCVILCSCSYSSEPAEICINRVFNAEINIQHNETAYTADFTCNENGCTAVFYSPQEISGMTVSTDGNEEKYSLEGMETTVRSNQRQTSAIADVYSAIVSLPESITENEQTYILQGTSKHGIYTMYIYKETCTPTFIEYEDKNITVKFSNIT